MSALLPSNQLTRLTGHKGPIHTLSYSSGTSQYLLSGSSDRTINLYNPSKTPSPTSNPQLIQTYTGAHAHSVLTLAVSTDNARFASGGGDKSVFLWDVASARTLRRFGGGVGGHAGRVEAVCFGGEGDAVVVSGSFDASVRFWDTKSQGQRPIMILSEARDSVSALAVQGHEVLAGSVDGRVRCYDLRMGLLHVDVIAQPVTSISPTVEGDSMLVGTLDSTLRLVDKATGKVLQTYRDAEYANTNYRIRSVLGLRDALVVAGSEDGHVCIWDVLSGERVQRVKHQQESNVLEKSSKQVISAVACKKNGKEWASAGGDGTIVVWG